MYSGGDSSGEGVNSRNQFNWQMTSQTSCNVNSGSIDWASLAQQWIQMKDSGGGLPNTPPPPLISTNAKATKATRFDEQGEADMEVEKEDEMQVVGFADSINNPMTNSLNPDHWFAPQHDAGLFCGPQQNQWTPWPARVALPPPILHVPITSGSLTPPILRDTISTTPPLQNLAKVSVTAAALLPNKESLDPPLMDAAKRKILPAWIREGLEKMEREKLKQMERELKDPVAAGTSLPESDICSKLRTMVKSSTTEMEGESSGNEANETDDAIPPDDDDDTDANSAIASTISHLPTNLCSGKTYEERMSDMMIAVRKTLTELLLEVTNEEISSIAHEAIRKRRAKASSAQVIRKSAIPSITGKLGLEAYADSDSDNSASGDEATNDDSKRSDEENDSEEELKANIRICKRAFAKTVEDIEERLQASAAREEYLLKEHQQQESSNQGTDLNKSPVHKTKGFDLEIGEPQPDKKSNSNGKMRKERTTRFSDNKDSRHRVTTSYYPHPSASSGNLSIVPGASVPPPSNFAAAKHKTTNSVVVNSSLTVLPINEKRIVNSNSSANNVNKSSKPTPVLSSSSSSKQHKRHSDASSSSSDSSSSGTRSSHSRRSKYSESRHKRSSIERSKHLHRNSRRRDSSESNDDDHYKKRSSHSNKRSHKGSSSSKYSRRDDRRRSDSRSSRSRTRSRSRSRSTYSSNRRNDRY